MNREDRRKLREKEKSLEKAIKIVSKRHKYKIHKGFPYKIVDGFLYEALISSTLEESSFYPVLCIYVISKPLILDEIFWKVFDINRDIQRQPESFYLKEEFTADVAIIDNFYQDFFEEENQEIVAEKILEKFTISIENSRQKLFDIDTFEIFIDEMPNQELNKILLSIIKKDYSKVEKMINYYKKNNISGNIVNEYDWVNIFEYVKDYIKNN